MTDRFVFRSVRLAWPGGLRAIVALTVTEEAYQVKLRALGLPTSTTPAEVVHYITTGERPMENLTVTTDLDATPWRDLSEGVALENELGRMGRMTRIGLLPQGTSEGRPTVSMLIELEDGRRVVAETTWALLRAAVAALDATPISRADRRLHP